MKRNLENDRKISEDEVHKLRVKEADRVEKTYIELQYENLAGSKNDR